MYRVFLLGGATIEGPSGRVVGRGAQRARIALLALLATSPRRSESRERVTTLVWPESDTDRARALLRDSIYRLKQTLGESAIIAVGYDLRINADEIRCDVCEFEDAVAHGDLEAADRLYGGPFLASFHFPGSPEFEQWADAERSRLADMHATVLESLASQRTTYGDLLGAVAAWRRRASLDPYNSRVVVQLMEALYRAGDRAGALHQAATYTALMASEFGADRNAEVDELAARLRDESSHSRAQQARPPTYGPPLLTDQQSPQMPGSIRLGIHPELSQKTLRPRIILPYIVAALIAGVAVATGVRWYSAGPATSVDTDLVAVVPFRVTGPDSSHNYLREGIVDLVSAQLTGNGLPRAVDTRAVLGAYRQATAEVRGFDLSAERSVKLARDLGARQVILGEFVAASRGASVSARLLSVPSGRLLAEHSETGDDDELSLITRLTERLLAKSVGEGAMRLAGLSDSAAAVRAYLAAMRAYRDGQTRKALDEFGHALEIDPDFASAALWRAYIMMGVFTTPPAEKRHADSVAWSFRTRVARRDSLILASLQSIGPNWPRPFTAAELIAALERAARANPDRPEVWHAWGRHLVAYGAQAGIHAHLARAIAAADSTIAIDSTFVPGLSLRLYLAVLTKDRPAIRKFRDLHLRVNRDGSRAALTEWITARTLGETARLPGLLERLASSPGGSWGNAETWSVFYGLSSLEEAERVARLRHARSPQPDQAEAAIGSLFRIAALRGHTRHALALADSLEQHRPYYALIALDLAEPGYDSAALEAVAFLESTTDTASAGDLAANNLCYTQLWRVSHGDTLTARKAIRQMRQISRTLDPASTRRAGRLELCPWLVEAGVARRISSGGASPALDTVVKLLLQGTLGERPHNFANLLVARWLESDGDRTTALAILRHMDPMAQVLAGPPALRMEGRLAESLGDRRGAIHAYSRFLSIRPAPEPGPLTKEMRTVRQELAALTNAPRFRFLGLW